VFHLIEKVRCDISAAVSSSRILARSWSIVRPTRFETAQDARLHRETFRFQPTPVSKAISFDVPTRPSLQVPQAAGYFA